MEKYSIAAQLYTLRDFIKTPDQIYETLKKVKSMGYNAIQVSGMGPIEPLQLREMTDAIGLTICATHTSYEELTKDIDLVVSRHKLWDCEYVGLGGMPQQFRCGLDGYVKFISEASEIAKRVSKSGLKFVYHNHRFEFEKFDGKTGMEILLDRTDPETFGFEIDTYWIQAGGANPTDWIKKVEGRMGIVHLKDMAIKDNEQIYAEIGEGNLDWAGIIKTCREAGVKWYAVEQDVCQRNPFESLEISIRYLEKFI